MLLPFLFPVKQRSHKLESYVRENFLDFTADFEDFEKLVFNQVQLLKLVLRMYRLSDIAENSPVEVAITLDGSKLTSSLFHVTCGIKICDVRTRDPISGELLLLVEENSVVKSTMQSRDHSIMFKMHLMKDTKDGYKNFRDFFNFFKKVEEEGLPEC